MTSQGRIQPAAVSLLLVLCLAGGSAWAQAGDWQLHWMRYTLNAKHKAGGHIAWVQNDAGRGAAFRCDKGILYAFVAVTEFDFAANLRRLGATRKNWNVTATVGDYLPREETWVSIHGGRLLMARRISTTKRLFRGARNGLSVTIKDKRRESTVTIPADDQGILDRFEALCELRDEFSPD